MRAPCGCGGCPYGKCTRRIKDVSIQQIAGEKRVGARGDANELLCLSPNWVNGTCKIVPGDLHVSSLLSGPTSHGRVWRSSKVAGRRGVAGLGWHHSAQLPANRVTYSKEVELSGIPRIATIARGWRFATTQRNKSARRSVKHRTHERVWQIVVNCNLHIAR